MGKLKHIFAIITLIIFTAVSYAADFSVNKLPNGQTVVIYEIHNNPIVTIDTWVKTGSINENNTNNGISHFLEHLFFKGTKAHPTGEIDRILESKGANVNAATSKDFTHYYITIPSEYFDTALDLHSDMLLNPQIPRKELEKERKVVLEEISKDANSPGKKVYENLNDLMYTTHPYKRKVIGTADIVGTMRREEILDYFNKYYAPSNMTTLIIGDVDTQKVLPKVQQAFNHEYKKPIKHSFKKEHPLQSQKRKVEYTDAQSGYMMIGCRGAEITNNDTFTLDILSQILGGGKSSRLYREIKEQKNLAYSISASNGSFRDDGIFYITANYTPSKQEKLENAIFETISNMKKYGITSDEVERAKKMIIQDTYYSRESTSNIASELGYIMTLTGSSDLYQNYINGIKKVSICDVQNALNKYISENKSAVSIILPKSMQNAQIQKTNIKHTAQKVSENKGIAKYLIDNDATLLINENKNNNIIAINIIAKGGEFIEKTTGEGTLVASTMLKGTKKYSAQELTNILDNNGIEITPVCDEDFFMINIKTTTAQIDKTLEILEEIVNNATFDDNELEKKRSEILSKIQQRRDVPMNVALEEFKTLMFEGSVYSNTNKILEKSLPKVKRSDVIRYYNDIFDAKNVIISINGNVNSENMIQAFGNIFSEKIGPKFDYSKYSVTKLNSPKKVSKTIKDLQTAWLFMGWQVSGVQDKQDFVTLKVINTLLGSGLSSRLYRNLRESDGLAYQLGSNYNPRMLGGTFMGYIGTNPSTLEFSRNKMLEEINKLKAEFVSDEELQGAKDRLKGGFVLAMETNAEKASNIGIFEAYGFGYDFLNKYIEMIDGVTASDIVKVSNKYFSQNIVQSDVR
ncbi:insulinase family protein [bacterium]|nr:insulinase family protein [bacterium]